MWRVHELTLAALGGEATSDEVALLDELVSSDPAACRVYVQVISDSLALRRSAHDRRDAGPDLDGLEDGASVCGVANEELPSVILDLRPTAAPPTSGFPLGATFVSYATAALIVGVAFLIAGLFHVAHDQETIGANHKPAWKHDAPPQPHFVGRITGAVGCRWSDARNAPLEGARVAINQNLSLSSGVLEITYDSGARVLLEGPCRYSPDEFGGYLTLGKLTARVTAKARDVEKAAAANGPAGKPARSSTTSPLFTIRTPNAKIVDLGTEFAVEVDRSGTSHTHVFQGKIRVWPSDGVRGSGPPMLLQANQSTSVVTGKDGATSLRGQSATTSFVRSMPKRAPIRLFHTGAGRKEGEPDWHWQIVAKSDEPNFQTRQAIVTPIVTIRQSNGKLGRFQLPNNSRSAWISTDSRFSPPSKGVTYTFRTTFNLTGMLANTAVLHGKFIADDRVTAIRLNGRAIDFAQLHNDLPNSFVEWAEFQVSDGFSPSVNVLEVDVWNTDAVQIKPGATELQRLDIMACRVELNGSATRDWRKDVGETEDREGD